MNVIRSCMSPSLRQEAIPIPQLCNEYDHDFEAGDIDTWRWIGGELPCNLFFDIDFLPLEVWAPDHGNSVEIWMPTGRNFVTVTLNACNDRWYGPRHTFSNDECTRVNLKTVLANTEDEADSDTLARSEGRDIGQCTWLLR